MRTARAAPALVLLLLPALAGCLGGQPGNPNLQPPCSDSSPLRIEIAADKEHYSPGEWLNVTLFLNNTGAPRTMHYHTWDLTMRAFDNRVIKTYERDENPDLGGATRSAPTGRATLQDRFQPFRATVELDQPLTPGLYYLCAVLRPDDGPIVMGARSFTADKPPGVL